MEFIYVRVLKTVQLRHIVCHSTVAHILFAHNAVNKIKQIILTYSYLVFFLIFSRSRARYSPFVSVPVSFMAIKWNYILKLTDNIVEKICASAANSIETSNNNSTRRITRYLCTHLIHPYKRATYSILFRTENSHTINNELLLCAMVWYRMVSHNK